MDVLKGEKEMIVCRSIRISLFTILGVIALHASLHGQQLPIYSQYHMNRFLINPAVAGLEGYTAFNLTAREQWLGVKDAPKTHAISVQSRILKNSFISRNASLRRKKKWGTKSGRVGYGVYLFNDKNGLIDRTGMQATYSYHIQQGTNQLSFGMSLLAFQFRLDRQNLHFYGDQFDELLNENRNTLYIPDANFGIHYSSDTYYAGFSASQLFKSSLQFGEIGDGEYAMLRHFNLIGGYKFEINNYLHIEPSMLLKYPQGLRPQADVNIKMDFYNDYWGGISYRTGNAIIIFGGVRFDKFYFGYAFDYTLLSINKHTYGSHEIMMAVKFGDNARRYKWLNRY
jgi:type IX secretion system PorP/SprF family membrane protein